MFISSPAPSWQKNLCFHLLALSRITIRGERGAQLQGVNQRSPSVLVGGWRGTERALKTALKRQRVPPRPTAGLTLVQAGAISPGAPSDRRGRTSRLRTWARSSRGCVRRSRLLPVAGKSGLGGLWGRRTGGGELPGAATATGARLAAPAPPSPPADGTLPPRLALRGTVGLPAVAADPAEGLLVPK